MKKWKKTLGGDLMFSKELFEKLYEEVYSPKLTPKNLLDNMKLDNYHSVDFFKEDGVIIAITKCDLPNGNQGEFKYIFKNEKLIKLSQEFDNKPAITLYDRENEINKLRNELKATIKSNCHNAS